MPALAKAFSIIRSGAFPAFSGVRGQISHADGEETKSGKAVSETGALRVAAIWIANTVLADEVASLTQRIVRKGDNTRELQQPSQLRALWSDDPEYPNPDQTRFGLDATEVLSMGLWGASYTMLGWNRGGDLEVRWPIDPDGVSLDRLEDGGLKLSAVGQGELFNRKGQKSEFCYVPLYTLPGRLEPVSPVRMAAELAGLSLAYQETAARLMGRGLNPSAILTFTESVDQDEADEAARKLSRLHGSSSNAGKVAAIGGPGPKLERLTMSMVDAEFVAQNDAAFNVLLAMWRVPPTVAGMVDKPSTWGTGVAEFSRGLERFTLRPIVQRRQAAQRKYITSHVDRDLQVKYIFDSLLSAAPKERVEVQRARLMLGATSVERVLAQDDEPPFAEDETVYTQLAVATEVDREVERMRRRAEAARALIAAGVSQERAFAIVGLDLPAQ